MCQEPAAPDDVRAAMPHPAVGSAADPIALEPVDDVVTTLIDNVYDALLAGDSVLITGGVAALTEMAPDLLAPGHCTGWRAQHALATALPDSWIQGSSGTRYQLTASSPRLTSHRLTDAD